MTTAADKWWTMKATVVTNQAAETDGRHHPNRPTASYQTRRGQLGYPWPLA